MRENPRKPDRIVTRRQFITGAAVAAGGLVISGASRLLGMAPDAVAEEPQYTPQAYLPLVCKRYPRPKVVHIHDNRATYWDFSTGWYGDYVDQEAVNGMVDQGVIQLTATQNRAEAWQALFPNYLAGQRVAIKINLNNARSTDDSDNKIDALIEPVNAVIAGLKEIGVAESDIWVYDAVRSIPDRLRNGCDFPGVHFSGRDADSQGFSGTEKVTFQPPSGSPSLADQRISNVLAAAAYLINMPIMKRHGGAGVTLSFKNHFGTIEDCAALHDYSFPSGGDYTPHYNPLVDIYENRHFTGKTVLTIGDGLYGGKGGAGSEPERWATFGNGAPNSLFFAQDPVAIDCVMYDFVDAEAGVPAAADGYLRLAAEQGLGVFEHRASGSSDPAEWYTEIDYLYLDLPDEV